jgi:hypothetical protein
VRGGGLAGFRALLAEAVARPGRGGGLGVAAPLFLAVAVAVAVAVGDICRLKSLVCRPSGRDIELSIKKLSS